MLHHIIWVFKDLHDWSGPRLLNHRELSMAE